MVPPAPKIHWLAVDDVMFPVVKLSRQPVQPAKTPLLSGDAVSGVPSPPTTLPIAILVPTSVPLPPPPITYEIVPDAGALMPKSRVGTAAAGAAPKRRANTDSAGMAISLEWSFLAIIGLMSLPVDRSRQNIARGTGATRVPQTQ